jgi:NitT/TauT family transport system substrate-binding protein
LRERRDLAKKFAQAHAELTEWILKNPEEAQKIVREELSAETTRPIPAELIARSWRRLQFTTEISRAPLEKFVADAKAAGFLKGAPDLNRLVEKP